MQVGAFVSQNRNYVVYKTVFSGNLKFNLQQVFSLKMIF